MNAALPHMPLTVRGPQPDQAATASQWVTWFWKAFLPAWTERTIDREGGGFFDSLDAAGIPPHDAPKTVLAQARLLFTFSHLALLSGDPAQREAAREARRFLSNFRKAPGLYSRAVMRDGRPTGEPAGSIARSYDQSFVILALATWGKLEPEDDVSAELEACWQALETRLTDPMTGLLLEDDSITDPSSGAAPPRAQNPHMHLYEAALQAFEMTGDNTWTTRAAAVRETGLRYFLDTQSGTICEFIAPDLTPLSGKEGVRREVGHQCEWAWLLHREADLAGKEEARAVAERLLDFAAAHGFAANGPMRGAAFDAVASDASWRDESFLMWPQTEAVKAYVTRFRLGDAKAGEKASDLTALIFARYFGGRNAFANQLDAEGAVLWPDALSRLLYHLVLALTEGASAGLWPEPTRQLTEESKHVQL